MSDELKIERENRIIKLEAELARLSSEYDDLKMLYEAMIEHGEAVEDQLAEQNLLLEKTQARLDAELNDAKRYVFSLLPPPRDSNPMTRYLLLPSTELGGDSFGYHDIDDDHLALYLLDVCGHGVGAALLSATAINVIRASALVRTDFRDPSAVLSALNATFPMERQNNMYFTIWYGVYQRSTGQMRYSSGGHPPAILFRSSSAQPEFLATMGSMVIGALPDLAFASRQIQIGPGDRLVIISDGTYEVGNADGGMLTLEDLSGWLSVPGRTIDDLLGWVRANNGSSLLPDDFSILEASF